MEKKALLKREMGGTWPIMALVVGGEGRGKGGSGVSELSAARNPGEDQILGVGEGLIFWHAE